MAHRPWRSGALGNLQRGCRGWRRRLLSRTCNQRQRRLMTSVEGGRRTAVCQVVERVGTSQGGGTWKLKQEVLESKTTKQGVKIWWTHLQFRQYPGHRDGPQALTWGFFSGWPAGTVLLLQADFADADKRRIPILWYPGCCHWRPKTRKLKRWNPPRLRWQTKT